MGNITNVKKIEKQKKQEQDCKVRGNLNIKRTVQLLKIL